MAHANKLPVRYQRITHDFVMVNSMRRTYAVEAAIAQSIDFLSSVFPQRLGTSPGIGTMSER